jgi:hypothetical protein
MEQERIEQALARIAEAARRIEAAAARLSTPAADPELARKHDTLRREAWAALAELDDLIEATEG